MLKFKLPGPSCKSGREAMKAARSSSVNTLPDGLDACGTVAGATEGLAFKGGRSAGAHSPIAKSCRWRTPPVCCVRWRRRLQAGKLAGSNLLRRGVGCIDMDAIALKRADDHRRIRIAAV